MNMGAVNLMDFAEEVQRLEKVQQLENFFNSKGDEGYLDVVNLLDFGEEMQQLLDKFFSSEGEERYHALGDTVYFFENLAIGNEYKDPLLWRLLPAIGQPSGQWRHTLIFLTGKYHSAYSEYVLHSFAPLITDAGTAWQYLVSSENFFGSEIPQHFAAAFDRIASFAVPEGSAKPLEGTQEEMSNWFSAENIRDALPRFHWD